MKLKQLSKIINYKLFNNKISLKNVQIKMGNTLASWNDLATCIKCNNNQYIIMIDYSLRDKPLILLFALIHELGHVLYHDHSVKFKKLMQEVSDKLNISSEYLINFKITSYSQIYNRSELKYAVREKLIKNFI